MCLKVLLFPSNIFSSKSFWLLSSFTYPLCLTLPLWMPSGVGCSNEKLPCSLSTVNPDHISYSHYFSIKTWLYWWQILSPHSFCKVHILKQEEINQTIFSLILLSRLVWGSIWERTTGIYIKTPQFGYYAVLSQLLDW